MLDDIKTFLWFLIRPKLYTALWDLILRNFFLENLDSDIHKKEAILWCEQQMSSNEKIYKDLDINITVSFKQIVGDHYFEDINLKINQSNSNFGGPGDLNLLYDLCEQKECLNVVETGVAYGWSTSAILHSLSNRNGRLCSVDMPMPKQEGYELIGIAVEERHKKNWHLIREPDKYGLIKALKFIGKPIDLIHYDSDKNYYGRKWAYPIIMEFLKDGGLFVSDDIEDNLFFKEYVTENNFPFWVTKIDGKFVGIIKKS